MLANLVQTKPFNHMLKLQLNPPPGFQSGEIVYVRYSLEAAGGMLRLFAEQRGVVDPVKPLEEVLADRKAGNAVRTVPKRYTATPVGGEVINERDIVVDKPCTVVVELSSDWKWQFRTRDVGMTSKEDYADDTCALWHVNPVGDPTPDAPTDNNCRLIYFSVVRRDKFPRPSFNLHVEMLQPDGASVEIIIDPDVPNNGGIFNFDPI